MEQREEANLALVKSWMAGFPMDLDILILDEIGKNISGAGHGHQGGQPQRERRVQSLARIRRASSASSCAT
jgi:hypothetical protein